MVAVPAAMKGKPRVVGFARRQGTGDPRPACCRIRRGRSSASWAAARCRTRSASSRALLARVDQRADRRRDDLHVPEGAGPERRRLAAGGRQARRGPRAAATWARARSCCRSIISSCDKIDAPQTARVVEGDIPDGCVGVDIGPKTIAAVQRGRSSKAATVVWNGPVGKFEDEPYSKGTRAIAEALAESKGDHHRRRRRDGRGGRGVRLGRQDDARLDRRRGVPGIRRGHAVRGAGGDRRALMTGRRRTPAFPLDCIFRHHMIRESRLRMKLAGRSTDGWRRCLASADPRRVD